MSTSTNSENQITCKEPSFLTRSSSLPLFTNLSGNIDSSTKLSLPPCFISYNCRLACRDLQRDIAHYKNYSDSPRMVPCMSSHILLPLISDKTLSWFAFSADPDPSRIERDPHRPIPSQISLDPSEPSPIPPSTIKKRK